MRSVHPDGENVAVIGSASAPPIITTRPSAFVAVNAADTTCPVVPFDSVLVVASEIGVVAWKLPVGTRNVSPEVCSEADRVTVIDPADCGAVAIHAHAVSDGPAAPCAMFSQSWMIVSPSGPAVGYWQYGAASTMQCWTIRSPVEYAG